MAKSSESHGEVAVSVVDRSRVPVAKVEVAVERRGLIDRLERVEGGLKEKARGALREYLRALPEGEIGLTPNIRKAFFGLLLLGSETAVAQETPPAQLMGSVDLIGEGEREMSAETREYLEAFLREEGNIAFVTQFDGENPQVLDVTLADVESGAIMRIESPIINVVLQRRVAGLDSLNVDETSGWQVTYGSSGDAAGVSKGALDSFGNFLLIWRRPDREAGTVQENIVIVPPPPEYAPLGTEAEYRSVSVDLTEFGGRALSDVFEYQGYEAVMEIGSTAVYIDAKNREALEALMTPYKSSIEEGITKTTALFGLDASLVKRILIMNRVERNASANLETFEIRVHDELFKPTALADESGASNKEPLSPEVVRDIISHEVMHLIIARLGLIQSEWMLQLVYSNHPHELEAVSERNFGSVGGHASDNPHEFLASFLNSLDLEDGVWQEQMEELDRETLLMYGLTLVDVQKNLQLSALIPDAAPIHELIGRRLVMVEARLEPMLANEK